MKRFVHFSLDLGTHTCSECGKTFKPYRAKLFGKLAVVCSAECQRGRKTRLQRQRRIATKPHIASNG